nr:DapH/DapD/GlmU-related protein [Candidatus Freyarchaeota archaeon]
MSSENEPSKDEVEFKGVLDEYKIGRYGGPWLSAHHTAFIILPMLPAFVVTILIFMLLLLVVDWFFSVPYLNLSILWPYLGYPQITFSGIKGVWQNSLWVWAFLFVFTPLFYVIIKFVYFLFSLPLAKLLVKPVPDGEYPFTPNHPIVRQWILNAKITGTYQNYYKEAPWGSASLSRLMYKALGCKLGKNVLPTIIVDPPMTEIGDNTVLGAYVLIAAHGIQRGILFIERVKIGSNCTIGTRSLIWPGVTMEDHVDVGTYSVITRGKVLPSYTVWIGVPAVMVKDLREKKKKGSKTDTEKGD